MDKLLACCLLLSLAVCCLGDDLGPVVVEVPEEADAVQDVTAESDLETAEYRGYGRRRGGWGRGWGGGYRRGWGGGYGGWGGGYGGWGGYGGGYGGGYYGGWGGYYGGGYGRGYGGWGRRYGHRRHHWG